jgi:hypothetical protein
MFNATPDGFPAWILHFALNILHFALLESTRSMPIEMLDWRFVPPRDLVDWHVEHGGDFLPLGRAWRPAAENDCERAAFLEPAALRKLRHIDLMFPAQVGDGLGHRAGSGEQRARKRKM